MGGGWKKSKYSRKAFVEERPQKHQGKKIQAKLLVPIKKINKINHNRNNKAEKGKNDTSLIVFDQF